jgi:hypothetical protein
MLKQSLDDPPFGCRKALPAFVGMMVGCIWRGGMGGFHNFRVL